MESVKYTAVINKYTSSPVDKLRRRASSAPMQREGLLHLLGAAGMFAVYFAVMACAIVGAVR